MAEWPYKYRYLLIGSIFFVIVALGVFVLWIRVGGTQTSPPPLKAVLKSFDEHLTFVRIRFEIRNREYTVTSANTQDPLAAILRFWQVESKKYRWRGPEVHKGKWILIGERVPNAQANPNLLFTCSRIESHVVAYHGPRYPPARIACISVSTNEAGDPVPYTLFSLTFEWKVSGGRLLPAIVTLTQGTSHAVLKIREVKYAPLRRKGGSK